MRKKVKSCFMEDVTTRIRRALKKAEISYAEIARRLSITPQAVNGWFRTGRVSKTSLTGVARETGVSLEYLMTGQGIEALTLPSVSGAPPGPDEISGGATRLLEPTQPYPRGPIVRVPIIGFAIANPDRDGYYTDGDYAVGHGEARLPWPSSDPNAYALRVKGDSMQPRIRPGEFIVVEPNRKAELHDDVLVKLRDGRKMVKQLLLRRATEVVLGSINQAHHQVTVPIENLDGDVQYVAGIAPRNAAIEEPRNPEEGSW